MAHIDISQLDYFLSDGTQLLNAVSFRVSEGKTTALIGPNGTGKTTLLRIVSGELKADDGAITVSSSGGEGTGIGVMNQFIGQVGGEKTVRDLLLLAAPATIASAAARVDRSEEEMMLSDDEAVQMRYAQALADWGDVGGYDMETTWDEVTLSALGVTFERAQYRAASTLSGGEQKRLVLEALFRGPDQLLLLDEPDNYLDVPGKQWLEGELQKSTKAVLLISHDRQLLANAADRIVTLEPRISGATAWTHGAGFASYAKAREDRNERLDELRRRWDEQHSQLKELVHRLKVKASVNDGFTSRYRAAQTRLRKFEEAGPPQLVPLKQNVVMRLKGGRTAKRAVVVDKLELTGLMKKFSTEMWFGDRVAVLGSNGSGKSHFLRLLAGGGSSPETEHLPVSELDIAPVAHTGSAKLGARIRPGFFAQTHVRPELQGRTLLNILHRGDEHRDGLPQEPAARALDRYALARQSEQKFESLSGGQQARFQILLLELSGATLLLLDEPTDNLDLESAQALQDGIDAFEGTVIAVTHDRWFAKEFDRFLVFGADGTVYESAEPVWDVSRVSRAR